MSRQLSASYLNELRRMAARSLYFLDKFILGFKDLVPHVHGRWCQFAIDPRFGRFRQATLPRSWMKSWTWTIGKSIWRVLHRWDPVKKEFIHDPLALKHRRLIVSNTAQNASNFLNVIRFHWEQNDLLKSLYPEAVPANTRKVRWGSECMELGKFGNGQQEGTFEALGVGGAVVSRHFDSIDEDDTIAPKKDDMSGSEIMPSQEDIDKAIGWHKTAMSLLADMLTGEMDFVATRWAPRDVIHFIRTNEPYYSFYEMAAVPDVARPCENSNFPERFPDKELRRIRTAQGPALYATQYLNLPMDLSSKAFQLSWLDSTYYNNFGDLPKEWKVVEVIVDLAGNADTHGKAMNVLLMVGLDMDNRCWLIDYKRGKFGSTDLINGLNEYLTSPKFKLKTQRPIKAYLEEVSGWAMFRATAKEKLQELGIWNRLAKLKTSNAAGAKDARIRTIEAPAINGVLHVRRDMSEFIEEYDTYPATKTKDILDCLGYFVQRNDLSYFKEKEKIIVLKDYINSTDSIIDEIENAREMGDPLFMPMDPHILPGGYKRSFNMGGHYI